MIEQLVTAVGRQRTADRGGDAPPALLVVRDGRVIVIIEGPEISGVLSGRQIAAAGYGADALAVCFEGVVPVTDANPLTGESWQRGEAEAARVESDAVDKGWVSEILVTAAVERDGDTVTTAHYYSRSPQGVIWGDTSDQPNGVGLERLLADALEIPAIDAAKVPDPCDRMMAAEDAPYMSPERGRLSLDVGCTLNLDRNLPDDVQVTFVARDDAEAEMLGREGLQSWQITIL